MKSLTPILAQLLVAVLLAGCAGYQKGSMPNREVATVYLEPVQNEAYISGIAPLFQSALGRGIIESPLLRPADSAESADMVAYVRLSDYEEQPIGYLESDTGQPISARVQLSAIISLWGASGNPIVEDETIRTDSAVYSAPETAFSNPIDQSKPAIVRSLAKRVVLELELKRPVHSPQ